MVTSSLGFNNWVPMLSTFLESDHMSLRNYTDKYPVPMPKDIKSISYKGQMVWELEVSQPKYSLQTRKLYAVQWMTNDRNLAEQIWHSHLSIIMVPGLWELGCMSFKEHTKTCVL